MQSTYPRCPFARYADDAVVHFHSEQQANEAMGAIKARLKECLLSMHPDKSKIVCKDSNPKTLYSTMRFTFLGVTFRPQEAPERNREHQYPASRVVFEYGVYGTLTFVLLLLTFSQSSTNTLILSATCDLTLCVKPWASLTPCSMLPSAR